MKKAQVEKDSFKLFLTLLAMLSAAVAMSSPARALERVRIAPSVRNVVFLPFYYAKDTKIFERYGLAAELIQMRSDLQLAGIVSGEIDFTPAMGPATFGIANGMPVKAFAVLYRAPLFSLVSPADLSNLKELEVNGWRFRGSARTVIGSAR
jgi:ABC-type nitrate/sulfonate/bicarbonate transport system substrate-binding protein